MSDVDYECVDQLDRVQNINQTKKKRRYDQRYRKQWESLHIFRGWLTEIPGQPTRAFCKACKFSLNGGRYDLAKHQKSRKHRKNFERFINTPEGDASFKNSGKEAFDCDYDIKPHAVENMSSLTLTPRCNVYEISPTETVEVVSSGIEKSNFCSMPQTMPVATDELTAFGQYVGLELKTGSDSMAVHRAKLEINKILFNLSTGQYDTVRFADLGE